MKRLTFHRQRNLIGKKLIGLRKKHGLTQRELAKRLQSVGYPMDKNIITRTETDKRYVSDMEVKAFCEFFQISADEILDLKITK